MQDAFIEPLSHSSYSNKPEFKKKKKMALDNQGCAKKWLNIVLHNVDTTLNNWSLYKLMCQVTQGIISKNFASLRLMDITKKSVPFSFVSVTGQFGTIWLHFHYLLNYH